MTPPVHPARWCVLTRLGLALSVTGLITALPGRSLAAEIQVDTELILLVDVSGSVTTAQFTSLMNSYAQAIASAAVVNAIQSGSLGKIATTLVFWGGEHDQTVAVPWMEISNAGDAQTFASLLLSAARPFEGRTAIGSALSYATPLFGTETGGTANGFQSLVQIIDVSGDGVDNSTPPRGDRAANLRAARDQALAAGVDMINGLPIGDVDGSLVAYYAANVIGGRAGGTAAFSEEATGYDVLEKALIAKLTREISAGAAANQAVPEPTSVSLSALAVAALLLRRSRS